MTTEKHTERPAASTRSRHRFVLLLVLTAHCPREIENPIPIPRPKLIVGISSVLFHILLMESGGMFIAVAVANCQCIFSEPDIKQQAHQGRMPPSKLSIGMLHACELLH